MADNASIEGERTAVAVKDYLSDPDKFRAGLNDKIPYSESKKNEQFNKEFFRRLNSCVGNQVCIVCPKSCILSEEFKGCQRGKDYLKSIRNKGYAQRLTTTIWAQDNKLIPVVTDEEIQIDSFPREAQIIKTRKN
jgi:hypothetical protein